MTIAENLTRVQRQISAAIISRENVFVSTNFNPIALTDSRNHGTDSLTSSGSHERSPLGCRLVAVSKTKPVEDIVAAYNVGQRHFGENYIQELVDKSNDSRITDNCPDIRWHFIGHLQSNKTKLLSRVPSLFMWETLDSLKVANRVNADRLTSNLDKVNVLIQVNTSGETQKSGVDPDEVLGLVDHVVSKCEALKFKGLMTIGSPGWTADENAGPNPDFVRLVQCRDELLSSSAISNLPSEIELSMGMSGDFLHAICMGSTNVRVGSSLFGARNYGAH